MKFGCFFGGQRPQLHEQYAEGIKVNPNAVSRTDAEVYQDILKGARLGDELGFDSVWVTEHAFSEHGIISSPHSLLAAIAAQTTRVTVGVAVTVVPWYHPIRMAQDLATLDIISQGRLIVGAGRGYQKREFDGYGIDISESRERFVEGMDIAIRAWSQERLSYQGKFYNIPDVMVVPKPVQKPHPPIWMAVTQSPESLEIAVQNRWSLITVGGATSGADPEEEHTLISLYHSKMVANGVAPEDISVAVVRNLHVAESDEEALALMKPRLLWAADINAFLRAPVASMAGRLRGYEHYGQDPFTDTEMVARRMQEMVGSPEKVNTAIGDLQSKKITHMFANLDAGGLPYEQVESSLRLFASKVMPNFS